MIFIQDFLKMLEENWDAGVVPTKKKEKKRKNPIFILSGKWGLSFAIVELCVVIYLACEG